MEAGSARIATVRLDPRQLALIAALLALAAIGWLVTDERMAGMDAGPGTDPGSLGFYVSAWVVMMGAMMFPSSAPMVRVYDLVQRRRNDRSRGATALFVAGYMVSWTGFGLAAYALFAGVRAVAGHALGWHQAGPYVAGGVIVLAAVYQLTPAKDACLRRCRAPFAFLTDEWREGRRGALVMGTLHGGWCVGCCWGLMAALFAVGVMSVGWMVFVSVLIAVEKLIPWPRPANYLIAAVLVALGLGVALAPSRVPGLTLPDSVQAMSAMHGMHPSASPMRRMHVAPVTRAMPSMPATHATAGA
jgi:predicted metal-binding membrane protein